MLKWEQQQKAKAHNQKISQAKSQVPKQSSKKSTKMVNDSGYSNTSSISGYNNREKEDKQSIPLYKLLKLQNLQQYAQELISRGYGYDLVKFSQLQDKEFEFLINDIKVLPGHKVKLQKLIHQVQELVKGDKNYEILKDKQSESLSLYTSNQKFRQSNVKKSSKTMKPKTSQSTRTVQPKQQQKKMRMTNLGYDFFQDESGMDEEFNQALEMIMLKYKNDPNKELSMTSGITTQLVTQKQTIQSQQKTAKKAQDDIVIINKFNNYDKMDSEIKQNKLYKNLEKISLVKKKKPIINDDDNYPDLQMSQIKHMFQSFESGTLTSTLVNLDIEEMCNCLAWAVYKHIQYQKKQNQSIMKNSSIPLSMEFKFRGTANNFGQQDTSQNLIEEPTQINYKYDQQGGLFQSQQIQAKTKELIINTSHQQNNTLGKISEKSIDNTQKFDFDSQRKQIQEILKESLLLQQNDYNEDEDQEYLADQLYEACSDDEDDLHREEDSYSPIKPMHIQQQQIQKVNNVSSNSMQYAEDSVPVYNYSQSQGQQQEMSLFQSKFDFVQDDDYETRNLYIKTYTDTQSEQVIPSIEVISNYCKNIIITSKMEKEVTIVCLVYIERLLLSSGYSLEPQTWRRILFISLVIASKIWDDESFENDNFAKVFPQYQTRDVNELERVFLILIDYRLYVSSSDYAKYYFILRTYVEAKKKSFPLKPLDLNTIMKLQKNTLSAEYGLKVKYATGLNKSF
ncbi:hypothetical protein pb186bvf_005772 [Paramecium bursaria]